jgi:hypothetical protein
VGDGVTERQRNILGVGSFALSVVGVAFQFGIGWAVIVAGLTGVAVALVLAVGAIR